MTPKIIAAMKSEQQVLDNRLSQINEQIERLKEEATAVRTNRDAIKAFLVSYGSEGGDIPEVKTKAVGSGGGGNGTRSKYGPTAETLEFLKAVYPSWASPRQIKENLAQSGMKQPSDMITRLVKEGKMERKGRDDGGTGYLYRLKVEYQNQDENPHNQIAT